VLPLEAPPAPPLSAPGPDQCGLTRATWPSRGAPGPDQCGLACASARAMNAASSTDDRSY
jgi:hypothetical protein